jgi:predicted nucleic-acid-binding Zn-ribbon protein
VREAGSPAAVANEFVAMGIVGRSEILEVAGYVFIVFQCPRCSYVELHDPEKIQ